WRAEQAGLLRVRTRAHHGLRGARVPAGRGPAHSHDLRPRPQGVRRLLRRARRPGADRFSPAPRLLHRAAPVRWPGGRAGGYYDVQGCAGGKQVAEAFLPAVAPGTIEHWLANDYYPSDEA